FKKFTDQALNRILKPTQQEKMNVEIITNLKLRKKTNLKTLKLEAKTEDRYEWVHFKYCTSYYPLESYHFQIYWLVCSASVIADFVQSLSRRAKQWGFLLIQTPINKVN